MAAPDIMSEEEMIRADHVLIVNLFPGSSSATKKDEISSISQALCDLRAVIACSMRRGPGPLSRPALFTSKSIYQLSKVAFLTCPERAASAPHAGM